MSRAVRSVTRAVSSVVRGATNVVRSVARGVSGAVRGIGRVISRVVRSPIGRAVMAAATIYFGGAAIMGAIGGAGAGTGFLGTIGGAVKGAGAGIANAWTGLTGAVTGGGLSSLSQGFTGAHAAGAGAVTPASMLSSGAVTSPVGSSSVVSQPLAPAAQGGGVVTPAAGAAAPPAAGGGLLSSDLAKYAAVSGLTQGTLGLVKGVAASQAQKADQAYQDQKEAEERARLDESARTAFQFSDAEGTGAAGVQPMPVYDTSRFAGGPAQLQNGLVGNQMYSSTLTNNRFPTYNPAYSRFV